MVFMARTSRMTDGAMLVNYCEDFFIWQNLYAESSTGFGAVITIKANRATAATPSVHKYLLGRDTRIVTVDEMAYHRAYDQDQRNNQPRLVMTEQHRVMVADHHHQNWQCQIVVVERTLLAYLAEFRVRLAGPPTKPLVIFAWFGMMTMNTLAAMIVPTKAPTWMKAPRPLNTNVKR